MYVLYHKTKRYGCICMYTVLVDYSISACIICYYSPLLPTHFSPWPKLYLTCQICSKNTYWRCSLGSIHTVHEVLNTIVLQALIIYFLFQLFPRFVQLVVGPLLGALAVAFVILATCAWKDQPVRHLKITSALKVDGVMGWTSSPVQLGTMVMLQELVAWK